jgi:uncharacterized protein (UPF0218 family)
LNGKNAGSTVGDVVLLIIAAVFVAAIAWAVVYDRRAKRRGWKVGVSTQQEEQYRLDAKAHIWHVNPEEQSPPND